MRIPRFLLALGVFALLAAGVACNGDDVATPDDPFDEATPTAEPDEPSATGTIEAEDQSSDGTTITVAQAEIQGAGGWVVIHRNEDGSPGEVLGHEAVEEGTSTDVTVTLDEPIESGSYWPMLHVDAGVEGEYEFPGADVPVTDGGAVVMVQIEVTVS